VDAESFPVVSQSYPNLAQMGAYHPTFAIYSKSTMQQIVDYGYQRGVRVVPEVDVPGHAYSWGYGYPTVRAQCPSSLAANINNYPLDPSQDLTFQILDALFGELTAIFTDNYFHFGGDEVVFNCWLQNPSIAAWMKTMGFVTGQDVLNYFEIAVQGYAVKYNRTIVTWQEVFQNGIYQPPSTIVEVWKDHATLQTVLNAGYKGLLAAGNYEDQQIPNATSTHYEFEDTWLDFYNNEPTLGITTNKQNIIGGEAAMWGEQVDDTCFDERVWPRGSAVGERLWSPQSVTDTNNAKIRLNDFRCRVSRRGINGGPIAPDYCPLSIS